MVKNILLLKHYARLLESSVFEIDLLGCKNLSCILSSGYATQKNVELTEALIEPLPLTLRPSSVLKIIHVQRWLKIEMTSEIGDF